jgi:hypothetical protein
VKESRLARTFVATRSSSPWLEDRDPARLQGRDLVRVLVDADHLVAEIGEACT